MKDQRTKTEEIIRHIQSRLSQLESLDENELEIECNEPAPDLSFSEQTPQKDSTDEQFNPEFEGGGGEESELEIQSSQNILQMYSCNICNHYTTNIKNHFVIHQRSHLRVYDRPYICVICENYHKTMCRFTQSNTLARHYETKKHETARKHEKEKKKKKKKIIEKKKIKKKNKK